MATSPKLEQYIELYKNFLPRGRLWRNKNSPPFSDLIGGMNVEPCRVDERVFDFFKEIDPSQTVEMLPEWENALGLPDECTPAGLTDDERRAQIVQKLTNVGGLSEPFYEFVIGRLGLTGDVFNNLAFVVGRSTVGQALTNYVSDSLEVGEPIGPLRIDRWLYYFTVNACESEATTETLEVGEPIGVPLRVVENELLECTMRKLKPAHSAVYFTYDNECSNRSYSFDGIDQHTTHGDVTNLERTSPLTIMMWIKANAASDEGVLFSKKIDGGAGWQLRRSGASLFFEMEDASGNIASIEHSSFFPNLDWIHLGITKDAASDNTGMTGYVNGIATGFAPAVSYVLVTSIQNTSSLNIASVDDLAVVGKCYNGLLDEIILEDRLLSAAEVSQHYNGGVFFNLKLAPTTFNDALGWWRGETDFVGNDGIIDRTPNKLIGSTVGSVTFVSDTPPIE